MSTSSNIQSMVRLLCSLGAHVGHLQVEAYQSICYYVLGVRSFFVLIDLDKTVAMLKSAIIFVEQMILHYGHVVFCHSSISRFSPHFISYISRIVNFRNQSFSYWKWVPGCITNYRYVFLRLVEVLFSEVRRDAGENNFIFNKSYQSSFFYYYKKLWFWFLNEHNISIRNVESAKLSSLKQKFHSFFLNRRLDLLNKYLAASYKRNLSWYEFIRHSSGFVSSSKLSHIRWYVNNIVKYENLDLSNVYNYDHHINTKYQKNDSRWVNTIHTLPSFISFLFRICYVLKHKAETIAIEYKNKNINEEVLFMFLFRRMHVFWRAIIFFKCFRKTANLPDCLILFNPDNSSSEFNDFVGVHLPVIGLADTTTEIHNITYPIPSNDDSLVLFIFYLHVFLESMAVAYNMRLLQL